MKILYYSNPYFADADFPLVRSLQQSGQDVTYLMELAPYNLHATIIDIKKQINKSAIIPANAYHELRIFGDYFDLKQFYIVNRVVWKESSLVNLVLTIKVLIFMIKGHYDVIHTDFVYTKWQMLLYALRKLTVLTLHDPIQHFGEKDEKYERFRKIAIRLVNKIILLNSLQYKEFVDLYQVERNKVFISNLCSYDCLQQFKKHSPVIENNILFFGRISPYKGLEYLCQAMISVIGNIPDATLTIAGGGDMYFDLSAYSRDSNIKLINKFLSINELVPLIEQCDIVVIPYTEATQSGVLMTAFALNKPVIATNVGGMSEYIKNGYTGLLIPPCNSAKLSDAIIVLLSNKRLKQSIISNINQECRKGAISAAKQANYYINIYQS